MRTLVKDFTFSLNSGDRAVIIGEEGNGKSTLLKLIYDERLIENYASWSGAVYKKGLSSAICRRS
jgi:ATPase subunit of ABC transporter with duplicated ATPase domains